MTVEEISNKILNGDYLNNRGDPYDYDGELSHYGVLGMKWGVRRTPEQLGHKTKSTTSSKKTAKKVTLSDRIKSLQKTDAEKETAAQKKAEKKAEKDAKAAAKEKTKQEVEARTKITPTDKKTMATMSDAELREAIQRLQLEKQYKDLMNSKKNTGAIAFGQRVVVKSAESVAKALITKYAVQGIDNLVKNQQENQKKKKSGSSTSPALPAH